MYDYSTLFTTTIKLEIKFLFITGTINLYLHFVFSTTHLTLSPLLQYHTKYDPSLQFIKLKIFCIEIAVNMMATYLLLKLYLLLNEICKTSMLKIVAKTLMNLSSSLINVNYNRDLFLHESFCKSFRSCWQH